jgi:hypothetical protein
MNYLKKIDKLNITLSIIAIIAAIYACSGQKK